MSAFTEQLFTDLAAAPLWDVAVSIKRGNPLPLDKDSIVHNQAGLDALKNSAVSYPGQIVAAIFDAVKDGDTVVTPEKVVLYYLDQNKNPQLVSPEVEIPEVPVYEGDGKTIEVNDFKVGLKGFTTAANGTVAMRDDDGNFSWKTLEEIGAGDGNDNSTYTFTAKFSDDDAKRLIGVEIQELFNGQAKGEATTIDLSTLATKDEVGAAIEAALDSVAETYATKATTLEGYGITDAYTKTEVDGKLELKANAADVYSKTDADNLLAGKADAEDVYTTDEVDELLADKADADDVYTKSEVYTKEEVAEQIAAAEHLKRAIVDELPAAEDADEHTIYMLYVPGALGADKYEEYMLVEGALVKIGDTSVDLTDYATKKYVDDAAATIGERIDGIEETLDELVETTIPGILDDYATKEELSTAVETINDTIGDLDKKVDDNKKAIEDTVAANKEAAEKAVSDLEAAIALGYETKDDALATKNSLLEEIGKNATNIADVNKNLADNYYNKTAVDGKIGVPATFKTDDEGKEVVDVDGTGIYANTYTRKQIELLIADITGGESAADVLAALNTYKGKNDARVAGIEAILNDGTADDGSEIPGLVSRVEANELAITDILNVKLAGKADVATVNGLADQISKLDETYAKDSELTAAVEELTKLINGKASSGDLAELAGVVSGHGTSIENHGTRIKAIEDVLPEYAKTADVNKTLEGYAKSANVAATYATKAELTQHAEDAAAAYATKAEITAANYVSYADTVVMNGGSATGFSIN